jgi:hypothetical protein
MRPCLVAAGLCWVLSTALLGAADAKKIAYLDLQPQANQKLKESPFDDANHLAELPTGEQTFADVKFKVDDAYILLSSKNLGNKPTKVEGIKVDKKFTKLYILHATHNATEEDAIIGSYTVNYEDKTQETIAIVYGKDVRDWWYYDDSKEPSRGKVAWKGENDTAKAGNAKIRLYLTTWKNPDPDKKVVSIDFASTNATECAPFCVAMSVEEK